LCATPVQWKGVWMSEVYYPASCIGFSLLSFVAISKQYVVFL
jgi:hypothetical protein